MTLGQKRRAFSAALAHLILWCLEQGYEVQIEEVKRGAAQAAANAASGTAGIANSLHLNGLAADLSIFKGGVFLRAVDEYRPMGEQWKSMNPEHAWGGDFSRPDANHFSRMDGGVK